AVNHFRLSPILLSIRRLDSAPSSTLFPYTTLFRSRRTRRRPGAVVVCGAILWPADLRRVPGGQAGVRPARAAEPGQDCRRPTDRRVAAVWNGVPDAAGAHLL